MARSKYLDSLRAAATYGVIIWHCVSPVYYQFGPENEWLAASVMFGFPIRWSVAMFVMISGALLLDRVEPMAVFYKKRFLRICIPLITWTFIYGIARLYYFKVYTYTGQPRPSFFEYIFLDQFPALFLGNLSYHLYFISIILGLYLIAPFLSRMIRHLSQKELGIFTLIGVLVYSIRLFVPNLLIIDHFEIGSYLVYFIAGYYLYRFPPGIVIRSIVYSTGIIAAILMTWLNYQVEYAGGRHQDVYYRTDGFFVYAVTIAVFVLFQQFANNPRQSIINKLTNAISASSYGIYIAHPLLISFIIYGSFKFFSFKTDLWTITLAGYRLSFIMNDAWGAIVQSFIMLTVLLLFFAIVKRLGIHRYFS